MIGINVRRRERGELWQDRFYDHALRTVREYNEKVDYIHLNPARRGLLRHATDWKWSSVDEYAGISGEKQERRCGLRIGELTAIAVGIGPGSFTGLRVGLTSVKAWSEVYGGKIAAVSRLEAIALQSVGAEPFVAAFVDAQRQQVFGGVFRRKTATLQLVGEELVVSPDGFLNWVSEKVQDARVAWISMDPEKLTSDKAWSDRGNHGETIQLSTHILAPIIGKIGLQRAQEGRLLDALALDAQYVRSDAEIFWKGHAAR
jgi:tRNA threonylcarbamoyladenosine biosynthesis protein TsaB